MSSTAADAAARAAGLRQHRRRQLVAPWVQYALQVRRAPAISRRRALLARPGIRRHRHRTVHVETRRASSRWRRSSGHGFEAGIRVKLNKAPSNDTERRMAAPFVCSSWSAACGDALAALHPRPRLERDALKRPEFDAFISEARATTDVAKRTEFYQKAQLLRDDGGAIISCSRTLGATRQRVGWKLHRSRRRFSKSRSADPRRCRAWC